MLTDKQIFAAWGMKSDGPPNWQIRDFACAIESAATAPLLAEIERLTSAIDEEMIVSHIGVFNRGDDPVKAIKSLMLWSQGVGEYFANEKLKERVKELETSQPLAPPREQLLDCDVAPRPLAYPLKDYHRAMTDGPLNFTWQDKPHRIVYDLISAVRFYTQAKQVQPSNAQPSQEEPRHLWDGSPNYTITSTAIQQAKEDA